ncbi:MAG: MurR/RpiR family transcriptional regulator [Dongiaceae bacterium]
MSEAPVTIRDLLTGDRIRLTGAELKVARELLANYPAAGLSTIAELGRKARVSDPTVLRLVAKLGFDGFPAFQRRLLREVEERMSSPLAMLDSRRPALRRKDLYRSFLKSCADGLEAALHLVVPADLQAALDLVTDRRLRVHFLGGRFSRYLAGMMRTHVMQLRPDTHLIEGTASDLVDRLVDIGPRDLLVVFDYRRYQVDTIGFAEQAAARGARIILFTDPWKSPIAAVAAVTLIAPVETISPYDTMVPAAAQVEAFIAALVARLTPVAKTRIRAIEDLRRRHGITADAEAAAGSWPGPAVLGRNGGPTRKGRREGERWQSAKS